MAELAYGRRDLQALSEISEALCLFPDQKARSIGLYYRAVLLKREGEAEESRRLLEHLSAGATATVQARAIHTLATIYEDVYRQYGEAARLHVEAMRAAQGKDAFTFLSAQLQLSAAMSYAGNHQAALADLRRLRPLVALVARQHPHLWPLYCNDPAYELGQVGRIQEARATSAVAVASPIAAAYPEWRETAEEIAAPQSSKAITVIVAIPEDAPGELEDRPRPPLVGVPFTLTRLPIAPPAAITAHLVKCAPIHGPPFFG